MYQRCARLLPLVVLVAACATTLPPKGEQKPSIFLQDNAGTILKAIVLRSLPPDADGFKLLPEPNSALQARLALIERAQRTLDLQYFIWNADYSGRLLLVALRDAALRGMWGSSTSDARRGEFEYLTREAVYQPPAAHLVPEHIQRYTTAAAELAAGQIELQVCPGARFFADPVEKASGVNLDDSSGTLHQRLIQLFSGTEREIFVVSPYFVRGQIGLQRIQALADRGVNMRLLTNSLASTDELLAHVGWTVGGRHPWCGGTSQT